VIETLNCLPIPGPSSLSGILHPNMPSTPAGAAARWQQLWATSGVRRAQRSLLHPSCPTRSRPATLICAAAAGGGHPGRGPPRGGPPFKRRAALDAFDEEESEDEEDGGGEGGYGDDTGQPGLDVYRMRRKQQRN
jgi:hypothetical protein